MIILLPKQSIKIKCQNPKNKDEWCIFRITAIDTCYQGDDPEIFLETTTGYEEDE